ncbi:MAG: DUF2066 domain-containing protein [Gammaproteobacteria bacterium]|nr:DUF2066 domain-containing protein [Gammaproteobacteria bacterium]
MRRKIQLLLLLLTGLSSLWALPAQAVVIKNLYEALVPVNTQSREERKTALTTGLIEVITRVSGKTIQLSEDPEDPIAIAIQNPTRFTRQFRYRKNKKANSRLNLWIKYDEKAVNNLLQTNNLPVWGHTRPSTLVWVVISENGRRTLLSNTEKHEVKTAMKWISNKRGLPLTFPLMDLTDRGSIGMSDIWGNFEDRVLTASQRYNPEAIIVGRLYKSTEGEWSSKWSVYQEGRRKDMNSNGERNIYVAVAPIVASTAEELAERFALVNIEEVREDVTIRVSGINGLKEFNQTIKYLQSLAAVTGVSPVMVGENYATFKMATKGGRLSVAQAIKLGHRLAEQVPAPPAGVADLAYQLVQ